MHADHANRMIMLQCDCYEVGSTQNEVKWRCMGLHELKWHKMAFYEGVSGPEVGVEWILMEFFWILIDYQWLSSKLSIVLYKVSYPQPQKLVFHTTGTWSFLPHIYDRCRGGGFFLAYHNAGTSKSTPRGAKRILGVFWCLWRLLKGILWLLGMVFRVLGRKGASKAV